MGYFDPPEPEAEGTDSFTCSMEVERKFVTPNLLDAITQLISPPPIPDPWAETRTPEQVAAMEKRMFESRIGNLKRSLAEVEEVTRTCGWQGETDYVVWHGTIHWDCPACGTEHADEQAADRWGPDEDYFREMAAEMEYDRMKEEGEL